MANMPPMQTLRKLYPGVGSSIHPRYSFDTPHTPTYKVPTTYPCTCTSSFLPDTWSTQNVPLAPVLYKPNLAKPYATVLPVQV